MWRHLKLVEIGEIDDGVLRLKAALLNHAWAAADEGIWPPRNQRMEPRTGPSGFMSLRSLALRSFRLARRLTRCWHRTGFKV